MICSRFICRSLLLLATLVLIFTDVENAFADTGVDIGCPDDIRPKIALALGGGGARGLAQLGVLSVLERENIKIDYVVGTSIGAIIGGLYSSGYSVKEIYDLSSDGSWQTLFSINNFSADRNEHYFERKRLEDRSILSLKFNDFKFVMPEGVSAGEQLMRIAQTMFWRAPLFSDSFDSLKYKFRAVATDLAKGETYVFRSGNMVDAVRASSTFPVMFYPVKLGDKILVDGGIMANIPVKETQEFSPDLVIAVKSASPLRDAGDLDNPVSVADQTISVTMKYFENESAKFADFLIEPQLGNWKNSDFSDPEFLFDKGVQETEKIVSGIKLHISEYAVSTIKDKLLSIVPDEKSILTCVSQGLTPDDSTAFNLISVDYSSVKLATFISELELYSDIKIDVSGSQLLLSAKQFPVYEKIVLKSKYPNITDSVEMEINKLYAGKIFDHDTESACIADVLKMLTDTDILRSTIQVCDNFNDNANTLVLEVHVPVLGNINVSGNKSIGSYLIKKEVSLHHGYFIGNAGLGKSWENIYNSGWFYSVEFNLHNRNFGDTVDLYIGVSEMGTQEVNLGMLINNERGTRFGLDLVQENLFNMGTRINHHFIIGKKDIFSDLLIEQPRIFSTFLTLKAEGYYRYSVLDRYNFVPKYKDNTFKYENETAQGVQQLGIKIAFGRQLEYFGKLGFELRFEKQRYYDRYISGKNKPDWYHLGTLKCEAIFDNEDHPYFPASGRMIDLSLEMNILPDNGVGQTSFTKAIAEYRYNLGISRSTFTTSMLFCFADANTPLPEEFNLGGQDNFFGLNEYNETGLQVLRTQIEYRYKMPFKLFFDTYASLRYDVGNVWNSMNNINLSDLKQGLGISVMFDTPIGPAKFSAGRCFYYREENAKLIIGDRLLYFSIGTKL